MSGAPESARARYALILRRDSPKPDAEIAAVVVSHLGERRADATARVRYGGGLIVADVDRDTADAIGETLRGIGVTTKRIDAAAWLSPPRGFRASRLEFGVNILRAGLATGRVVEIRRDRVRALHVYALIAHSPASEGQPERRKRPSATRAAREAHALVNAYGAVTLPGGPLSERGRALLQRMRELTPEPLELHATLYCASPLGPVRLRKDEFDFASLGEDRQEHSLDNFIVLLEKLLTYLPDAWNRERAATFVDTLDPSPILYFKPEEAQHFDRWMLQWVELESEVGGAVDEIDPLDEVGSSGEDEDSTGAAHPDRPADDGVVP